MEESPSIGLGVTEAVGSDRYPGTIVAVPSATRIIVQRDDVLVEQCGVRVFTRRPDAPRSIYTLRRNGRWVAKGVPMRAGYGRLAIGNRDYYLDPSF
jgi:hypothetical protein